MNLLSSSVLISLEKKSYSRKTPGSNPEVLGIVVACQVGLKGVKEMAEEHEASQPYKCAICGAKFDSQVQLQNHLKSCTQKKN